MPKIADLEMTPNPNARKFILKDPLTYGVAKSFENADEAMADELASQLFAVEHVTSVFYVDNWLTVTQDGQADWQQLMRAVAGPIREAPAAAGQSEEFAQAAQRPRLAGTPLTPATVMLCSKMRTTCPSSQKWTPLSPVRAVTIRVQVIPA
jgi:hypothetical protein